MIGRFETYRRSWVAGVVCLAAAMLSAPLAADLQSGPLGSVRVTSRLVNIRAEPNLRGAVLTQVPGGTVLPLHGVEGEWYQVRLTMGSLRIDAYVSNTVSVRVASEAGADTATVEPEATVEPSGLTTGPPVERHGLSASHLLVGGGSRGLPPAEVRWRMSLEVNGSPQDIARAMPAPGATMPELPAGADVSYVWLVDVAAVVPPLGDRQPRLVVQFQDAVALDADGLTVEIVRLARVARGGAVVSVVRGRVDQPGRTEDDWDVSRSLSQDTVRTNKTLLEPGTMHIQPSRELQPGEYALVVRPERRGGVSGPDLLAGGAMGNLFSVAWPFTVAAR